MIYYDVLGLTILNTAKLFFSLNRYDMDNTLDGLYIAPVFMDKLVVHITKNFLTLSNIKGLLSYFLITKLTIMSFLFLF